MSKIFVVTDIERGKGLIIDYKADSNGLYTSSSLIEIYVYSGANTAFYRVMSIPTGSKNIEIKIWGRIGAILNMQIVNCMCYLSRMILPSRIRYH